MEFCKACNAATESQRGNVIPVEISVYEDRSFTFTLKTPPAARMLLKAAGVAKGSAEPHKTKVAKVTWARVREIAETKKADLNANDIDQAAKIIAGEERIIAQKTVVIPAQGGLYVLQMSADGPKAAAAVAQEASAVLHEQAKTNL